MRQPLPHGLRYRAAMALLVLVSACATSSRRPWGRGDLIEIQVVNDLIPPREVTVAIAYSGGGSRMVLGSVSPSQRQVFRYRVRVSGADYVLMAGDAERHEITSRAVPLSPTDAVVWSLRNNQLDLRRPSE